LSKRMDRASANLAVFLTEITACANSSCRSERG
jgi:hypothetical protein